MSHNRNVGIHNHASYQAICNRALQLQDQNYISI